MKIWITILLSGHVLGFCTTHNTYNPACLIMPCLPKEQARDGYKQDLFRSIEM